MKWAVHLQIRREARASWKNITTHRNKLLWDLLTVSVLQFPEWWLHRPAAPYAPLDGGRDRRNYWGITNTSRTDRCTSRMSTTNRALEPFKEGKYRVTEKGWEHPFSRAKLRPGSQQKWGSTREIGFCTNKNAVALKSVQTDTRFCTPQAYLILHV